MSDPIAAVRRVGHRGIELRFAGGLVRIGRRSTWWGRFTGNIGLFARWRWLVVHRRGRHRSCQRFETGDWIRLRVGLRISLLQRVSRLLVAEVLPGVLRFSRLRFD